MQNLAGASKGSRMKINEITEGWKGAMAGAGVGAALGGPVGALAGGALGAIAGSPLKALDWLGGGTGDVGTAKQRAANQQKQTDKKFKQQVASYAGLGHTATEEFLNSLRQHGVDITRKGSFDPAEIQQELKYFAEHFFGSDRDKVISQYVMHEIEAAPLPNQINPTTIQQYLETINQHRTAAITNRFRAARTVSMHNQAAQEKEIATKAQQQVDLEKIIAQIKKDQETAAAEKNRYGQMSADIAKRLITNKKLYQDMTGQQAPSFEQPAQAQQTAQQPAQAQQLPTTPAGVQLIRNASTDRQGRPTPTVVRYRRQDFGLLDDGRWINIMNGKPIPTALASFLQHELESI